MKKASRPFQIFAKPAGALCNLSCSYCYYLEKKQLYPDNKPHRMDEDLLETYIRGHIRAFPGSTVRFSWHGGEPTMLGLDYFQRIIDIQKKHHLPGKRILNGIQTNGTLLTEEWCRFFAKHRFSIGLSLDGPEEFHDAYRMSGDGGPTHERVMRGYTLLRKHGLTPDILCVVNALNVQYPGRVYRFFKQIGAAYIGFLPLVERMSEADTGVTPDTVPATAFGDFLCTIFDEWKSEDVGKIRAQLFEETAGTALNREHELCIFRETCGDVPVIEHNGDFFSCDHFVDPKHMLGNIKESSLVDLLEHPDQIAFGENKYNKLPRYCRTCDFLAMCNGECPKNRFIKTPDNEEGLNYLCAGYKQFFRHALPFVNHLASLWKNQHPEKQKPPAGAVKAGHDKPGRNDPCPCGSGKKYKKCCLGR